MADINITSANVGRVAGKVALTPVEAGFTLGAPDRQKHMRLVYLSCSEDWIFMSETGGDEFPVAARDRFPLKIRGGNATQYFAKTAGAANADVVAFNSGINI